MNPRYDDSEMSDFLHLHEKTSLHENFRVPGSIWSMSTNCEEILQAARETFPLGPHNPVSVDFSLRIWVDRSDKTDPPWPNPYVRGLDNLIFLGFAASSSVLIDLSTLHGIGRVGSNLANDRRHWRLMIFPMIMSVIAGELGSVELHSAAVSDGGKGLMLAGASRSGKSTLAFALTRFGFRLLSDDRTFCSSQQGKLVAWGMPRPIKLRSEAAIWFDEFKDREPTQVPMGDWVFHYEPARTSGRHSFSECDPKCLVFLDRQETPGFQLSSVPVKHVQRRIERELMAESPDGLCRQSETIQRLSAIPCYTLRYGGEPHIIAERLAVRFLEQM